jgi:hypothetical protein
MKYYRCYEVYIQKILEKHISESITFLPYNITMPKAISKETALDRINDLIKLFKGYTIYLPYANYNDATLIAIDKILEIL